MKEFKLPDLGEGVHEGQVLRIMVKPGDSVREDQPLMEVETDKAAVVIPCPFSGVVQKVHVEPGEMVHIGEIMVSINEGASIRTAGAASSGADARTAAQAAISSPKSTASPARSANASNRRNPASPAVRKLARSMGIDIDAIAGTGPGGRVQRADVESAAHSVSAPVAMARDTTSPAPAAHQPRARANQPAAPSYPIPNRSSVDQPVAARVAYPAVPESLVIEPPGKPDQDQYGPIKRAPLTQARKTIATVMAQSWSTIPHATDFEDADVTELDKLRKGYAPADRPDRKITLLAFVIRAVVRALQRFPEFNASIDVESGEILYKRYINIAVGVHTERGLVPMVLRDADRKSIPQISDELHVMGEKARTATFAVNDTRGGTYTISNAGAMGGSRHSTPIITPPQVAVLALGRTRWMPWVIEQEHGSRGLAPRLIMPLSHSIDHRLLDGGQEVQFMQQVIGDLQNPARLLL